MWISLALRLGWGMLQVAFYQLFGCSYLCGCGHRTKWKTVVIVHGHYNVLGLNHSRPDFCPSCAVQAAIQCAWCDGDIFPDDPITLDTPRDDSEVPPHAVVFRREPTVLVAGCLRTDCAESVEDKAGTWVMPGKLRLDAPLDTVSSDSAMAD